MSSKIPATILVVEDDHAFRSVLVTALQPRGYGVLSAANAPSAIATNRRESPEMAVVDLRLATIFGLKVVRQLRTIDPTTPVVVLTGYGSIATALEAVRLGAVHYLTKPTDARSHPRRIEHGGLARTRDLPMDTLSVAQVEWEHLNRVLTDCGG